MAAEVVVEVKVSAEAEAVVEAEEMVASEGPEAVVVEEVGRIRIKMRAKVRTRVRVKVREVATQGTRPRGMRTCPHLSPAFAIGPMGNPHIFVWSRVPAPGNSTGFQNPITNEIPTSSIISKTTKILKIYYIRLHFQK